MTVCVRNDCKEPSSVFHRIVFIWFTRFFFSVMVYSFSCGASLRVEQSFSIFEHNLSLGWRFDASKIDLTPPVVFTTDQSKAVVLVLVVLFVTLLLLAEGLFLILWCSLSYVVFSWTCLAPWSPGWGREAGYFVFLWSVACILSVIVCVFTKTCQSNSNPRKSHFYTVKLGFTGICIICLTSSQNIDCGYLLEPPRRGGSNE